MVIFCHSGSIKLVTFIAILFAFYTLSDTTGKWRREKKDEIVEMIQLRNTYFVLKYLKVEYYFNRIQNKKRRGNQ